jgi:hypothetical protein
MRTLRFYPQHPQHLTTIHTAFKVGEVGVEWGKNMGGGIPMNK